MNYQNVEYNENWYEYLKDKDNYTKFNFCDERNYFFNNVSLKNVTIKNLYFEKDYLLSYYIKDQLTIFGINNLRIVSDYLKAYDRRQKLKIINSL